jgi:hypothetical protein
MTKLNAGTPVKSGYYFGLKSWSVHPVANDGEKLPGDASEQWVAVSMPMVLVAAPLLGAGFLMFMPFIGFYMTAKGLARPIAGAFRKSTTEIAATMSPGLVPGEAHLTGKRAETTPEESKGPTAEERELDALQKEIDARRNRS